MYEKFFENSRRVVAGIPEHLLKRAQAARDALAGKAPSAETGESASNLPAKTSETKPAPAAPAYTAHAQAVTEQMVLAERDGYCTKAKCLKLSQKLKTC